MTNEFRTIATRPAEPKPIRKGLTAEEKILLQKVVKALHEPETSELATGKLIVEDARPICEKYREFRRFLNTLPFTQRTAYRRIKVYERALEIWPKAVIDAAIKRSLPLIGWSDQKPMGAYEDIEAPPKNLTPQKIEEYLSRAEFEVRRGSTSEANLDCYEMLKEVFREADRGIRGVPEKDRQTFVKDLVGLLITLSGETTPQTFKPAVIPAEFWTNRTPRSPEVRRTMSQALKKHWQRVHTRS